MEAVVVTPPIVTLPPTAPPSESAELLRQLLEVQREQLTVLRAQQTAADDRARWRAMYGRHESEFPHLPADCRSALPHLERAYLTAIAELTAELNDPEAVTSEFTLNELLDRHAPRIGMLWSAMSQVGQLAAAAPPDPR